jgi:hypothetical protein
LVWIYNRIALLLNDKTFLKRISLKLKPYRKRKHES